LSYTAGERIHEETRSEENLKPWWNSLWRSLHPLFFWFISFLLLKVLSSRPSNRLLFHISFNQSFESLFSIAFEEISKMIWKNRPLRSSLQFNGSFPWKWKIQNVGRIPTHLQKNSPWVSVTLEAS